MQAPVQITFLGLDPPDGADARIRQHAAVFERYGNEISSCHVVVDMPHRDQREGSYYAVRIYLTTLVGEVATTLKGSRRLDPVIAEAFAAAASELDARLRKPPPRSGVLGRAASPDQAVVHPPVPPGRAHSR